MKLRDFKIHETEDPETCIKRVMNWVLKMVGDNILWMIKDSWIESIVEGYFGEDGELVSGEFVYNTYWR